MAWVENNRIVNEYLEELKSKSIHTASRHKTDKELFVKLLQLLPSDGCIEYISVTPMNTFILQKNLEPFIEFNHQWKFPEHEFLDKELESKKISLYSKVSDFIDCTLQNFFPVSHREHHLAVPREWKEDDRERYDEAVDKLQKLSDKVVFAHEELVRFGRSKLNC
jgi:hypothetical protein